MRCITVALLLALLLPATGLGAPQDVPAGKMFRGELLDIRAPNSDGWKLVKSSPGNWSFALESVGSKDTYVASVLAFPLPESQDREEFLESIRQGIEEDTSPDRFTIIGAELRYTEAREYPCVTYQATSEDKKAKTSLFKRESQKLEVWSLYCRHPKRSTLGFAVVFSHRGPELDPHLEQQAQDFMDGIQVPPAAVAPLPDDNQDDT